MISANIVITPVAAEYRSSFSDNSRSEPKISSLLSYVTVKMQSGSVQMFHDESLGLFSTYRFGTVKL